MKSIGEAIKGLRSGNQYLKRGRKGSNTNDLSNGKWVSTKGQRKKESVVQKYSKNSVKYNDADNTIAHKAHKSLKKIKEEATNIVRHRSFANLTDLNKLRNNTSLTIAKEGKGGATESSYGILKPPLSNDDLGFINTRQRRLTYPSKDMDLWLHESSASHTV
jgi:hypothetical protein